MQTNPRGLKFWIRAWWLVAAGIAVVAMESTAAFGADRTTHPLRWLVQLLFGHLNDNTWDAIHGYIRKSGHLIGYGALGLTWLRAWWMSLPGFRIWRDFLLALAGTALVASCDEWHQTYVPNRNGSVWDVLLDCCGALIMLLIAWVVILICSRGRQHPSGEEGC
jgi:VanZ family protein